MATNPHILTYVFAESEVAGVYTGFLRPSGDRVIITFQFTINASGDSATHLARTQKLFIKNFGQIKLDYDFDKNYLVPAEYDLTISDINGEFLDILYDGALVDDTEKEFYCKVEIKYKDASSYITEFSGYNVIDGLEYNPDTKQHSFKIMPKTNILNETHIFSKEYDATKFAYYNIATYPSNPLNLNFTGSSFPLSNTPIVWDWKYLTKDSGGETGLIEDIFRLINPSMDIDVRHDGRFWGYTGYPYSPDSQNSNITFQDLIADSNWIGSVFAEDKHSEIKTIGDLLRNLAFEFGAMAGVLSNDKAFFRQMFYNDNDPQDMGILLKGSHKKKYKYDKIDFASITSKLYEQDSSNRNRYKENSTIANGFRSPFEIVGGEIVFEEISGDNGLEKEIVSCADVEGNIFGATYISNLKAVKTVGEYYDILAIKHPNIDFSPITIYGYPSPSGYLPLCTFLAEYYYHLKGLFYKSYIHEFIYWGLQYDFLRTFVYDSDVFSMVSINKNLQTGKSTIEAIKISDQTISGGEGTVGTPILDPLQSETLYSFGANINFSYQSFGSGGGEQIYNIGTIRENELLESIHWAITEPFNESEITSLRIYDGTGTLLTDEEMDFTEINLDRKNYMKRYTGDDTFYLGLTPNGTLTQGAGYIVLKKLRREF